MSERALQAANQGELLERVLVGGDLSKLSPSERLAYYRHVCDSLGLNPLTRPFDYITLNGKLTLYARKDCTDQLRRVHGVSMDRPEIRFEDDWIIVTVSARDSAGRTDSDVGVVSRRDMRGDFGNALMKAVTKAKRRVTLSICGLGMLDETEVDSIPGALPGPEWTAGGAVPQAHVPVDVEMAQAPAPADTRTPEQRAEEEKHFGRPPEIPAPPKLANGNGRPYSPEKVKDGVLARATKQHVGGTASKEQRALAVGALNLCFAGDPHANEKWHSVLRHLFRVTSMNDVSDPEVLALLDWLKPSKDSGGAYAPDAMAVREAGLIVRESLKAAGQLEPPMA